MIPNMDEATISDMLQMIREWRAMKATGGRARPGGDFQPVVDAPIYVHNAYAGEIPPAACMQVTGVEKIGQINYYVVDRPADTDGSSGWYLFNRFKAIPEGGMGIAQRGVELLAFKDSGDSTSRDAGDLWGPVANQFYLAESSSGPFVMAGDDDRIDDGLRVLLKGGSTGVTFYRFTLNEAWTAGVADADILTMSGTDTGTDADVNDPLGIFADLTTDDPGICFLQDGVYYAIQAPCP